MPNVGQPLIVGVVEQHRRQARGGEQPPERVAVAREVVADRARAQAGIDADQQHPRVGTSDVERQPPDIAEVRGLTAPRARRSTTSGCVVVSAQRSSSSRSSWNAFCSTWASRITRHVVGRGQERRARRRLQVRTQERARHPAVPGVGPRRGDGAILDAHDRGLEQRGERRVVERADHARDVAQAVVLAAPLGQRLRRRAVEVDDDEVLAGVEHLLQVVVAVRADAQAGEPLAEVRLEHLQHLLLAADQPARRRRRASAGSRSRLSRSRRSVLPTRLRIDWYLRAPIERRVRLGREAGVVHVRRQRQVHLGGALSEQRRQIEVGADDVAHGAGGSAAASSRSAARRGGGRGVLAMARQHALEEPAQLLARVRPRRSPRWGRTPAAPRACSARRGGGWYSIAPTMAGVRPGARAFRKRPSSSSGLTPSSRRRNIFSR